MNAVIPYPPVFRDWQFPDARVATAQTACGVRVDVTFPGDVMWRGVDLTATGSTSSHAEDASVDGHG